MEALCGEWTAMCGNAQPIGWGGRGKDWGGRSHMSIHWLHRLLLGRMRKARKMRRTRRRMRMIDGWEDQHGKGWIRMLCHAMSQRDGMRNGWIRRSVSPWTKRYWILPKKTLNIKELQLHNKQTIFSWGSWAWLIGGGFCQGQKILGWCTCGSQVLNWFSIGCIGGLELGLINKGSSCVNTIAPPDFAACRSSERTGPYTSGRVPEIQ